MQLTCVTHTFVPRTGGIGALPALTQPSSGKISRSATLISLDHSPKIDNNDLELRFNTDRNEPQLDRTSPPPLIHLYLQVSFLSFSPLIHIFALFITFSSFGSNIQVEDTGRRYMSQPIALRSCASSPAKIKLVIGSTKM